MQLLSVNVGQPREVPWRGQLVRTAIWKERVDGRRFVHRLNVDGDGQADLVGHGGEHRAVFVYQLASHRHWEQVLGRRDFVPGQFGRELHRRGLSGRRGVRRRPLPHRRGPVRGHPAAGHLLQGRDPDGRAADARLARRPRTSRFLSARPGGRTRGSWRHDREGGRWRRDDGAPSTTSCLRQAITSRRAAPVPSPSPPSPRWRASFQALLDSVEREMATATPVWRPPPVVPGVAGISDVPRCRH